MVTKISDPKERIILALDFPSLSEARNWTQRFKGKISTFKVGPPLFFNLGSQGLREIQKEGEVFLDLKFHDIPFTVANSVREVVKLGARMFTIHSLGGVEMMKRAVEVTGEESERLSNPRPLVLAVTILTSQDEASLKDLGIVGSPKEAVLRLAGLAEKAGVDGLVASGEEVGFLKREFGNRFTLVVPGIRLTRDKDDHQRAVTTREAILAGADYLVVGRAITGAENPESVYDEILASI